MKKDTTFSIRISSNDLDTIKRKAKQARMSQSDYVTRRCLGRQVVVIEDLKETATRAHSDRKTLRKEREKKIAHGHKEDDHAEEPTWQQTM